MHQQQERPELAVEDYTRAVELAPEVGGDAGMDWAGCRKNRPAAGEVPDGGQRWQSAQVSGMPRRGPPCGRKMLAATAAFNLRCIAHVCLAPAPPPPPPQAPVPYLNRAISKETLGVRAAEEGDRLGALALWRSAAADCDAAIERDVAEFAAWWVMCGMCGRWVGGWAGGVLRRQGVLDSDCRGSCPLPMYTHHCVLPATHLRRFGLSDPPRLHPAGLIGATSACGWRTGAAR